MRREKLIFAATCDLAGQVRGKAFPVEDLQQRLSTGVGYTHSNIMMSAFGPIFSTPFGTAGDLMLVPDPSSLVDISFSDEDAERFCLGDLLTMDRTPWECCPRDFLKRGLTALRQEAGIELIAAFEHEFVYTGIDEALPTSYGIRRFRGQGAFGEMLMGAIRAAGAIPDSFLPEYGLRQFEVTVGPKPGLRAADEAVIVRELTRAVAHRLGRDAIFAPMMTPNGTGNGTHIHFSLIDQTGRPVMPDASAPQGLSEIGSAFVAGVLSHLPAMTALTAASIASYYRLTPGRWAPTQIDFRDGDRGAALRLCPVFAPSSAADAARKFNVEYRVADATSSPYMALGAVVHAGLEGIRRKMTLPRQVSSPVDGTIDDAVETPALPPSLDAALSLLEASATVREWMGSRLHAAYVQLKRSELEVLAGLSEQAVCDRYVQVY
jgi:glutamine synthetase